MTQQTFIFIGRSGCGKGTQAKLLSDYLKLKDPQKEVLYIQSGQEVREFIKGESTSQKLSKEIYDVGGLQPEFLIIYLWASVLVNKFKDGEHIIMDGMPRKYHEAGVLESVFSFFKIKKPIVINIDISKESSIKRLLARKRYDDNEEDIAERLSWYETDVVATLDYYRKNKDYRFFVIDGEKGIEAIHQEILEKAGLK